ncbi:MAG: exosome complex protein Rrp42 [Candidatus Woesearchaeota archaeon]
MNYSEKEHLIKTLNANLRYDGRKLDEFRELTIETDVITTAEGSARVKMGNTEVLAGVKLSIGTPYADSADEGVLMVGCELLPIAHEDIESGPPGIDSIEIGRVIDRGIRESKAIDTKKLCITPGEKVWMVSVDVVPLNHDGNIIDIGAIAALAALKTTRFPEVVDGNINYKKLTNEKLVIDKEPIAITVTKVGGNFLIDPTKEEESIADARLTVTVTADNTFCSLQKGGEEGLTSEEIEKIFDIAIEKSNEIRSKL